MPLKSMDLEEFLEFLKDKQGDRTSREFATELGISPQYLSDIYNGRKDPGQSVLKAVHSQRLVRYRVDDGATAPPQRRTEKK